MTDQHKQSSNPKEPPAAEWDHSTHEAFFDYYAEESLSEETLARSRAVRELLLRLRAEKGDREKLDVADIGCAAGAQSALWAELGHRVHGLDVNERLVELARKRAREAGMSIEFTVGSAVELPWPDASMDICLVLELLEHVADWERCLDEFARILKPGGMVYLSTTNTLCPKQEEFNLPLYSWYPAPLKRYCERLAVTTQPQIANYAKYPAVNWFTFYSLRDALAKRGVEASDRFDVLDIAGRPAWQKIAVETVRAVPPLRWLAHVATPYTAVVGVKR